jgi:hypothetical protein
LFLIITAAMATSQSNSLDDNTSPDMAGKVIIITGGSYLAPPFESRSFHLTTNVRDQWYWESDLRSPRGIEPGTDLHDVPQHEGG